MLMHKQIPSIIAIYIAKPPVDGPMPVGGHKIVNKPFSVSEAEVVRNMGIVGDRWFGVNHLRRSDGQMIKNDHARNITFFEAEKFIEIQEEFNVKPEDIRRNVLVDNISLNDLVGKEFIINGVRFVGSRLSHGCDRIERITKIDGLNKALLMRGGIRAAVLDNGIIKVGDNIKITI